jgi:hypothetical protein
MTTHKQTKLWTTREGAKIRICDMTDGHLSNTIKMLERIAKAKIMASIEARWSLLATLQGEMACMTVENEIAYLEKEGINPSEIHPLYDNLVEGWKRRGLAKGRPNG